MMSVEAMEQALGQVCVVVGAVMAVLIVGMLVCRARGWL